MGPSATFRTSRAVLGGLVVGLTSWCGCSSGDGRHDLWVGAAAGASGTSGGALAGGGAAPAGASGANDGGGPAGATSSGTAGSGDGGLGDDGLGEDILGILPTLGCGQDPGQALGTPVMYTMQTSGTKAADCADHVCGPWAYTRQYFVKLPADYDRKRAYPLLIEGSGCGGNGTNVYTLAQLASSVIRVGVTPPPNDIGHATNPGQGCFDNKEGDDSVDWVFYEDLYDKLAGQLCFDRTRVFGAGQDSGGWFANELGCRYAGDATRPIRGVLVKGGGLPTDARSAPACTSAPMAGMWVHGLSNVVSPFADEKVAIARAMHVNGCTLGTGFDDAVFDPFPISATDGVSCKMIRGCPDAAPLVVCPLQSSDRNDDNGVVDPGWSTFITLFEHLPLPSQ